MKNAQITQAIAAQLAAGADIETAINTVFGAGAYQKNRGPCLRHAARKC